MRRGTTRESPSSSRWVTESHPGAESRRAAEPAPGAAEPAPGGAEPAAAAGAEGAGTGFRRGPRGEPEAAPAGEMSGRVAH